jgi:hypothetical protein
MAGDIHQVAGVFRDLTQARLAIKAARQRGLQTSDPDSIVQDAAGAHVSVRTGGSADEVRQLLLEYGAYSATSVS